MSCRCSWCGECGAARKLEQLEEPREKPVQGSNHSRYPKSKKQRIDALKQAEKDFWYHFERKEEHKIEPKRTGWVGWHWSPSDEKWYRRAAQKYTEAMMLCVDAKDVPPVSWYGMSH